MAGNRKKILFLVEAMGGGVFTYMVDLANELVKTYDIYIAYAVRSQTPANYREQFDPRIQLIEVEHFVRSINPSKDIRAFFEIRKIADRVQPDIIHLHSSKAGALGRWAFNGKRTPIFYTPHGYSFLMQNQNAAKRLLYKSVEKISGKRRCTTISCSEGEHRESCRLTRHAAYVNNGINVDKLKNVLDSVATQEQHPFTVFTLGRICYQKNPVLFNKIALAMPDVHFVWIGDGEMRAELSASNIEITGWAERETALRYSMQGDVFILTSLWEGLPMSLLEAMYMRKLCIVSDVIGNRDVIHTGENGFVCRTAEEFVTAIRETQNGDTQDMIENAYTDILETYNTKAMAGHYSDIYREAMRSL